MNLLNYPHILFTIIARKQDFFSNKVGEMVVLYTYLIAYRQIRFCVYKLQFMCFINTILEQ